MSNNQQLEDYASKVGLLQFFGAVKGSINDINSKVIDGNNVRVSNIDLQKLALEYDTKAGTLPQPQPQQHHIPVPVQQTQQQVTPAEVAQPNVDDGQLFLPFDKKYDINDIFSKIDEVYRKIISLENEVYKLKDLIENKKKEL
jgi:hypothetical protein